MKGYDDKNHDKPFELVPAGTYSAVCYRVVGLGTFPVTGQYAKDDKGNQKYKPKVSIYFEIDEKMSDGRPFMVFETFPFTMQPNEPIGSNEVKSRLRKFLKSWLNGDPGGDFDLENLLGKPCLLSIIHNTNPSTQRTYANIGSVMPLPKGTSPLKPSNEVFAFDVREFDAEKFEKLSDWVKATIRQSKEYQRQFGGAPDPDTPAASDDDIPF
jgi:hypothetical protein